MNTDSGLSGIGEVGLWPVTGAKAGVRDHQKDLAPLIVLKITKYRKIWEFFFRKTFGGWGAGTFLCAGMSAIDIALWDIKR